MIPMTMIRLLWKDPIQGPPKPHLLRGAFAQIFSHIPLFHQHKKDGFIYRYPLIQYRWQKNDGILVGFHEGAEFLAGVPFFDLPLNLGGKMVEIADIDIRCQEVKVSVSDRLIRYRFVTPWLPLNKENYQNYLGLNSPSKASELDRLAIANILMMLKGLHVNFPERLYAAVDTRKSIWCGYKDQKLLGFLGSLVTNADLPSNLAIGKSVSHGFGWFERVG